jgi:hypothetical protein
VATSISALIRVRLVIGLAVMLVCGSIAHASPTMVRLGYARCSVCHLAPQGAGLLTDYGKGIDEAQSLRQKDYQQPDSAMERWFRYDARAVASGYGTTASPGGVRPSPPSWFRSFFRNSAAVGSRHRLASTVFLESPSGRPSQLWEGEPVIDALAAWEYRASDAFTFSVNRDRLPRGVELGETPTVLQDETDRFPAQVRAFLGNERALLTTYGYAPGSSNAWDRRAYGAGMLGEVSFLSNHLVLGGSLRYGTERELTRRSVGAFVRLGFGPWGVLAEHEIADRESRGSQPVPPDRYAGYTQLFFAAREWLVTSLIAEQVHDLSAPRGRTFRWRPEVQARLSSYLTLTASVRSDARNGSPGSGRIYLLQVAMKTVQ